MFTFYDYFTSLEHVLRFLRVFKRSLFGATYRECLRSGRLCGHVTNEVCSRVWRERDYVPGATGAARLTQSTESTTRAPPRAPPAIATPTIVPSPFR